MPFSWNININPNPAKPSQANFDPPFLGPPKQQVEPGDQVFWANNDTQAHWPGLLAPDGSINKSYFMPNQIAPNSQSSIFAVGSSGTLKYACSLHPGEIGTIKIVDAGS